MKHVQNIKFKKLTKSLVVDKAGGLMNWLIVDKMAVDEMAVDDMTVNE